MNGYLIGIVALVAANIVWDSWRSGRAFCSLLPQPYRARESREDIWRQRWDEGAMEDADALLKTVCDSFSFNPDDRYKLTPDDRIRDVYRGCYPRWKFWQLGDNMEIESLAMRLEEKFGIDISKCYPEITLGKIVDRAIEQKGTDVAPPAA